MADKKISALTAASTPLAGTEVLPIVQSGATVKVSVDNLTVGKSVETGPLTVKKSQAGATTTLTIQNGNAAASSDVALAATTANGTWTTSWGRSTAVMKVNSSNAIDVLSIAAAGDITVNAGNLVVGTSGKGIDFSATSGSGTSELLADYEEGTWTPIDSSGAGLTLTVNSATYTKIGRVVTAFAYVVYPSTVSGATVTIGGLPFTTRGSNGGFQPFPVATDATIGIYGYTAQSATTATFYNSSTNAVITNANISTKFLLIAITYTT